ncbi:MAG: hypothetical protein LBR06_05045 [Bacteroidales bacterium]|jgi:uncharacterized protein YfaS (alpha-2-macroglobulin family)|nr:hypothetical protein [Bacteroidales bacterium]
MRVLYWIFAGLLLLGGCGRKEKGGQNAASKPVYSHASKSEPVKFEAPESGFSRYVSSFTSGMISVKSNIVVQLLQSYGSEVQPGSELPGKIITLTPSASGKVQWVDAQTLVFIPDKELKANTQYSVRIALNAVVKDIPDRFKTLEFSVRTLAQGLALDDVALQPYDYHYPKLQRLQGAFVTSDCVSPEQLEKAIQFKGLDKPVEWQHNDAGTRHSFAVDSLSRGLSSSEVEINWDGRKIGGDSRGSRTVEIPSTGKFKIVDVAVVPQPEQYIRIRFSDPLLAGQNLTGAVHIESSGRNENIVQSYQINMNELKVYYVGTAAGAYRLTVAEWLKNSDTKLLNDKTGFDIHIDDVNPAVRFIGAGNILPTAKSLVIPFEAVNLRAVEVVVVKILRHNMHQYFQSPELRQVGRLLLRKKISLQTSDFADLKKWNTYSIDLAKLFTVDPTAMYHVQLRFYKSYSLYGLDAMPVNERLSLTEQQEEEEQFRSMAANWDYPGWYNDYYYSANYNWKDRNNPATESYYNSARFVSRDFIGTDIGIIAKGSDNNLYRFAASNLATTQPESGVKLSIYNYQRELLETALTDGQGMASVHLKGHPYLLTAEKDGKYAYLQLENGKSLSLSNFDIGGQDVQRGIKGFIYGERGVWRPGDKIYLTFVMEDELKTLPQGHPVIFELTNPRGQVAAHQMKTEGVNGFYLFEVQTAPDAPTGVWTAQVSVGGSNFYKSVKVETVKPNRLKIDLNFGQYENMLTPSASVGKLTSAWLHGGKAGNLKATVSLSFKTVKTEFQGFPRFIFDDPAIPFSAEPQEIFSDRTDADGNAAIHFTVPSTLAAPGMLQAMFNTRLYENTGDFSSDVKTVPCAPYSSFVGVRFPESDYWWYKTATDYPLEIVTLAPDGSKVDGFVEVDIYAIDWNWWWDAGAKDLARYVNDSYRKPVISQRLTTRNGAASFPVNIKSKSHQRYLIRVKDLKSGHSTGFSAYFSPNYWWESDSKSQNATMLTLKADKDKYTVGDKAVITIPSGKVGKALVSLENGNRVIDMFWVNTEDTNTQFSFDIIPDMAPNVYVFVSLLQPHGQTANDAPIRFYGVIPLSVEDPQTRMEPVLKVADELRPDSDYEITVSEKSGREMTYTIAVVDEGLLSLTRFKTPDPWATFYAREALGVRTWDYYDNIVGAYGAALERAFAVGGDENLLNRNGQKQNRFDPVVSFIGPLTLSAGKSQTHKLKMPNYVGAVRVMAVAGHDGAYGCAEKEAKVTKPLMVLATLPRILSPDEDVKLPVNVFAMKPEVKEAEITVVGDGLLQVSGTNTQKLTFSEPGDKLAVFSLKVAGKVGKGTVKITAKSGSETATQQINMDIRAANPRITVQEDAVLQAGEKVDFKLTPVGIDGTNAGHIEVSAIPPLNLGARLQYLIQYPYGCTEQRISAVFPQLFLDRLLQLTEEQKSEIAGNIREVLSWLPTVQTPSGGFAYWPGNGAANEWCTNYVGHFCLLAEAAGYSLPHGLKNTWLSYQRTRAREKYDSDLVQAYRLYTLALAGQPEYGAMNILREKNSQDVRAKWRLAAAYAKTGRTDVAAAMINSLSKEVAEYRELSGTYGSALRDKAMIVETLAEIGRHKDAFPLVQELSDVLGARSWLSTQETAYCLLAVSQFAGQGFRDFDQLRAEVTVNGVKEAVNTAHPSWQKTVEMSKAASASVNNTSGRLLYVRAIRDGIPAADDSTAVQENLLLDVNYKTADGAALNPGNLKQGAELVAEISVHNPGQRGEYKELALTSIFPAGWEIANLRLNELPDATTTELFDYQDIRDDRVYTFFSLRPNERKTFRFMLTATYEGRFYQPAINCEAMYDNSIVARRPGQWVRVSR